MSEQEVEAKVIRVVAEMTFPEAIKEVTNGKKIRRNSWPKEEFGLIKDGLLMIKRSNGLFQWTISDGDLNSDDWVTL